MTLRRFASAIAIFASLAVSGILQAQSPASATQQAHLEVFGTLTGTRTGIASGKNIGITAGADLAVHRSRYYIPYLELRGAWPFYSGDTNSYHDLMGGLKFSRVWRSNQVYADALFGRAEIEYQHGGLPNPSHTFLYRKSPSNIFSLGAGMELPLGSSFGLRTDVQWQRYNTPVSSSGHANAFPISIGVLYRFGGWSL